MYAARTALHMMPPAQAEHQRRNNPNSVHNVIPATPPLLQHYKLVSKGKLRSVYLIMIIAVILFLIFGVWLNHSLHLQHELSSTKTGDNNKSENKKSFDQAMKNNNLPPKLHHGAGAKHNVDVDDNLVNPIPTHSKPRRNEREPNFDFVNYGTTSAPEINQKKENEKIAAIPRKFPFYFPKNRPPQDTIGDTVDCDTATSLHVNLHEHRRLSLIARKQELEIELRTVEEGAQKNEKNGRDKESIEDQIVEIDYLLSLLPETKHSANPCLRLLMFSTLKPCTSEENIWAQFAAISSWVAIPLHPSPTVILYDTALRTEFEAEDPEQENSNNDKNADTLKKRQRKRNAVGEVYNNAVDDENLFVDGKLHEKVKILHKNAEEAAFVTEFAQKYGIILSDKNNDGAEEANYLKIPPSVTNYSSPSSPFAFEYLEPPASVQNSCSWLLIKMIHKYFRRPTLISSKNLVADGDNNKLVLFPRIALVAPTKRLVGQRHSTLLLGRALHHLEKTVMPALRPSEEGIFDVVSFSNSDIIFNSEHLATILANGMRSLRRFMFIGRRQSLSIDSIMETIKSGFLDQTSGERKLKESEEMAKRKSNLEKRDTGNLGAADGIVANVEDLISTVPIWHGFSFFDKFFPTKFSANSTASLPKILFDSPENSRNDRIDAEDYFFWTRGFLDRPHFPFSIPPFHIGRPAFDNWLVNNAIHSNQPVVDITYTHLIAIHVEGSKNRNKMSNGDRAYWGGGANNGKSDHEDATIDTKENYALGESHGGWQHGLLEFAPLKLQMLFDLMKTEHEDAVLKERIGSERRLKRRIDGDNNAVILLSSRRNKKNVDEPRNKKIDDEDRNDADDVDNNNINNKFNIKYLHRNKNDIRLGMKRKWKGLEGVGKILETPQNYWKHIEKNFFFG